MAKTQTNNGATASGIGSREWELLIGLDRRSGPLHLQIRETLRDAIRTGRLRRGAALPPSRRLAAELGCSRWAVTEAYGQLVAEGYLEAVTGSGTIVAWASEVPARREQSRLSASRAPRYDLAPGLPDLGAFPRKRWADALRAAVSDVSRLDLGHLATAGHPKLRSVLADYVVRTRGADADPRQVLVTTSVTSAVHRLCAVLRSRGATAVACEDPGWTRLRDVITSAGLRAVPIPTDRHGIRVDDLRRDSGIGAVLVTPAHQFPTGAVLVPARRNELLAWAREADALVIEDDYDAEYRYDRDPVATLQGMDPGRVALLKSVSKMLSPALGIGWMVVPPAWVTELSAEASAVSLPSAIDQLALSLMLESGGYDRHLRAGRARYRQRRDVLVRQLGAIPAARITGSAAGLHLVLRLPDGTPTAAVVAAAAARGLQVTDLDDYRTAHAGPPGLVLGYGNIATPDVPDAVGVLATAIAVAAARPGGD